MEYFIRRRDTKIVIARSIFNELLIDRDRKLSIDHDRKLIRSTRHLEKLKKRVALLREEKLERGADFEFETIKADRVDRGVTTTVSAVKLLTVPTAQLKSPVRLGLAPPSKTGSSTQMTPNPNSNLTRTTPSNLRKALTPLTSSDPANRIWSLIRAYGQTSYI